MRRELPGDPREDAPDGVPTRGLEALLTEPAEIALLAELERRRTVIDRSVELGSGFRRAFTEAARIGPAVDRFFTEVFVMTDDPAVKDARLRLMKQVEQSILQLADVSEIVPRDVAAGRDPTRRTASSCPHGRSRGTG